MTDTAKLPDNVDEILAPEAFDVLDFVTGDLTPRDSVTIYTDAEAGYKLDSLLAQEEEHEKSANLVGGSITDEEFYLDPDVVDELKERIENSALTFKLKALAPAAKKAIRANLVATHNYKEGSDFNDRGVKAFFAEYTHTMIAKSTEVIIKGNKLDTNVTVDKIKALEARLPDAEFAKLDSAVFKVNTEGDLFDRAVSADFLSKH